MKNPCDMVCLKQLSLGGFIADNWAESLSLAHFETMKMNGRCDTTKYIVDNFYMHQGTFHDVHWWCWVMIIYFNNTRFSSLSKNTSQQESIWKLFYKQNIDREFLTWMDRKIEFHFYNKKCFRPNMGDDPCRCQLETNQVHLHDFQHRPYSSSYICNSISAQNCRLNL